jgi:hypothetical protein
MTEPPDLEDSDPEGSDPEARRLVARALESVLQAVPELPGGDVVAVESAPTLQPWAETAEPAGTNKRSLAELIAEMEARVAAAPGARAGTPGEPHPADAYLDSLAAPAQTAGKRSGKRRWHGRARRRGGGRRGREPGGGQRPG